MKIITTQGEDKTQDKDKTSAYIKSFLLELSAMPVLEISPLDVAQYELSQRLEVTISGFLVNLLSLRTLKWCPLPTSSSAG